MVCRRSCVLTKLIDFLFYLLLISFRVILLVPIHSTGIGPYVYCQSAVISFTFISFATTSLSTNELILLPCQSAVMSLLFIKPRLTLTPFTFFVNGKSSLSPPRFYPPHTGKLILLPCQSAVMFFLSIKDKFVLPFCLRKIASFFPPRSYPLHSNKLILLPCH